MTSLIRLYSKNLLLELSERERRTTLFRKSCARRVRALATDFTEPDVYEMEMLSRVGVESASRGQNV